MFNEEIDMTLECAMKVRKHLVRILEQRSDEALESKLEYVNRLIIQADNMQSNMLAAVA